MIVPEVLVPASSNTAINSPNHVMEKYQTDIVDFMLVA